MTIQEPQRARSQSDGQTTESPGRELAKILLKESSNHLSSPTVMESMATLDLTKAKKIQSDVAVLGTSPHAVNEESSRVIGITREILKSPRTLLRERRSRAAKLDDQERTRKHSVEQALKKCHSRDKIAQSGPISLEEMSSSVFDMNKYQQMEFVKRSRSRSFNKHFVESIQLSSEKGSFQSIDARFINDYVNANVRKCVDTFMNKVEDFSSISSADLEKCILYIARGMFSRLCIKDRLYTFVHRNLLTLKVIVGRTLEELNWKSRTELSDELVEALEYMLCSGAFPTRYYKLSKETLEGLDFYEKFISLVKDPSIRSLLLKAIHPNEEEALNTLKQLSFWGGQKGYCELVSQTRNAVNLYLKHHNAQEKMTCFRGTVEIGNLLGNVDLYQVARSYIMCTKRIYNVLSINKREVKVIGIKGTAELECQQQFYQKFLNILYDEGYAPKASDRLVYSEAEKFLEKKPFIGQEVLIIGSNSAWRVCDLRLREMFPLLFNATFKTRMNQGIECYIQVESQEKYSIQVNRTYTTYPQPEGVDSTKSFAIDHKRPLCNLEVSFQVDFCSDEGWSFTISTPSIVRKKATDEEWEGILNILLAPEFVEGMVIDLPENEQLQNALKSLI